MQSLNQLKKACVDRIWECFTVTYINLEKQGFSQSHIEKIKNTLNNTKINFSSKLTSTAGLCKTKYSGSEIVYEIVLSTVLLDLNKEKFIKRTPGHEAAHAIDGVVFQNRGHGRTWKKIMRMLGQEPTRCHDFEIPIKNKRLARCNCKDHYISKTLANRIKRDTCLYVCKLCKGTIHLVNNKQPAKQTFKQLVTKTKSSKAEIVRNLIAAYKAQNMSYSYVVSNLISNVAKEANLNNTLAKTYISNNWNKV